MALGILAAMVVPSLMRARVSTGFHPDPGALASEAAPPTTMPAFARQYEALPRSRKREGLAREIAPPMNTEAYHHIVDNAFLAVADTPLSTFSIDVDTASYANVRRFLRDGQLPPTDAVRIEELINYFPYDYPGAARTARRSRCTTEVAACPWNREHRLVAASGCRRARIADGQRPAAQPRVPARRLRLDGRSPNKLPLVKHGDAACSWTSSTERDRVAIVVYAGRVAASCCRRRPATNKGEIRAAIDALRSRRLDQRRRGHPARLRAGARSTSSRAASTA